MTEQVTTQQPDGRKEWSPVRLMGQRWYQCRHCNLDQAEHISGIYCPEWRLRQLDGDR